MPHATVATPDAFCRTEVEEDAPIVAWAALRRHLEAKNREINLEVAHYPRPIARCDVQLSKLLEQRARVYRELARIEAIGNPPSAEIASGEWKKGADRFISETEPDSEDEVEVSLRADLIRALWLLNQRNSA
jgi:hypothetical protein